MWVRFIRLDGHSTVERNAVISEVKGAINRAGSLVDFKLFSNSAISLSFELARGAAERLRSGLWQTQVVFDRDSKRTLDELVEEMADLRQAEREQNILGTMHITFLHDEPDLRREVPKVPG